MLRVAGLTRRFGTKVAVDDLSFHLPRGEVLGLIGPNGAGKTTAMRCIMGLLKYNSGVVEVDEMKFDREHARECRLLIGYVPEIPVLSGKLTAWEQLQFAAQAWGCDETWVPRAEALLDAFDLSEKRDALTGTLSKGQMQKVMISATFLHEPRMIFLDEPLIGMDPRGGRVLKDLISEAVERRRASVLVSSHVLPLVEEVCDQVLILDSGRKIAMGSIEDLARQHALGEMADLEDVFLDITDGVDRT